MATNPMIDEERNDLLADGNDEEQEWIATLQLDVIVWVPCELPEVDATTR